MLHTNLGRWLGIVDVNAETDKNSEMVHGPCAYLGQHDNKD
jgi:hypothetical protein